MDSKSRFGFLTICLLYLSWGTAQSISDFTGKEWTFNFLMCPGKVNSVTTNFHATNFILTSDSTVVMGMSEAAESGNIRQDSTLLIRLYDYNSTAENKQWAESFKVILCTEEYLVLVSKNRNYEHLLSNQKGVGDVWYVYSNRPVRTTKNAKRLYKVMSRKHRLTP